MKQCRRILTCYVGQTHLFLVLVLSPLSGFSIETTILHNQTKRPIQLRFRADEVDAPKFTLKENASVPLSVSGTVKIWYTGPSGSGSRTLQPESVYRFSETKSRRIDLRKVPLSGLNAKPEVIPQGKLVDREPWPLRIKIAVDDDERTRQAAWEKKITNRIVAASRLLEYFCGVRLEIVAVTRWKTNDSIRDFNASLQEFEATVPTKPAQLVIGFTSQYDVRLARQRLGGTRGPLRSHILIREHGPRIGESERLEVLLHELGHYLGAVHSASQLSLMRPVLGDDQSNARSFQLSYDPINMLVMNLVSNQIRQPGFYSVRQIPIPVQQRLLDAYNWLAEQQPGDNSAIQMARVLCGGVLSTVQGPLQANSRPRPSEEQRRLRIEFRRAVQIILGAVGSVADAREKKSWNRDTLTEAYVRAASAAAAKIGEKHALKAFYFALAIAFDRGYLIKRYDAVAEKIRKETDLVADASRERFMGDATIYRRASLLQDFISAGVLAQFVGSDSALDITTLDEIKQATDPAGFSFASIAVSRAGIRLHQALATNEITFSELAKTFTIDRFVPSVKQMQKFWTSAELEEDYGGTEGIYFQREIEKIQDSVDKLPPYQRDNDGLGSDAGNTED
ncbi:MAG: matrixin family metalloprotease [Planctomycetota bacterium]|nr:matrixin family metalloprotease [Planctomycetota bacterium]